MSWDFVSFSKNQAISSGFVSPDASNVISLRMMSWLAFVCGNHTHNVLKTYADLFLQNIHGLVLISENRSSKQIVGYCFKAKVVSSHMFYQNMVFYDLKDANKTESFLAYCREILRDDYPLGVTFADHFPQPPASVASSSQELPSFKIGRRMVTALTFLQDPMRQMAECMMYARSRYGLVFKPFSRGKHHECVSLCVGTPMGREIAHIQYSSSNKSFGAVKSLEDEVSPLLLECFMTNKMGSIYHKHMPSARSLPTLPPLQKHKLQMTFSLHYDPILAGNDIEMPHSIHIYPTQGFFVGKQHLVIDVSQIDPHTQAFDSDVEFAFTVSTPFIPDTARFNVDVYATYPNETNQHCVNQAGFASFSFGELTTGPVTSPLAVPASNQPSNKGTVAITLKNVNMVMKARAHTHSVTDLSTLQNFIYTYIERNREFYEKHPPSIPCIQRVTVFGFQTRTIYIPGSLFDVFNLPNTKEEFFINCLLYAYHRRLVLSHPTTTGPFDYVTLKTAWISHASQQEKVCTVMDMLSMFVNYCTYQTDEVDHNTADKKWRKEKVEKMDSFDDIMARMNGDCEDFTMEILREVMTLKYNNDSYSSEIIVLHVIPILRNFVFVSGLAGVSSQAISGSSSSGSHAIGGHECVYAIPNYIFFKALNRGRENDPLLYRVFDQDERNAGADIHEQIYILEGTGNLFPEPRSKSHRWAKMEAKIMNCDSDDLLENIFSDYYFYNPNAEDNFYKMIITLLTPEFYFQFGIPIFEFLVVKDVEGTRVRGVSFTDLLHIDDHPDISILACPTIPPLVLQAALSVHENDYPPTPLVQPAISEDILNIAKGITHKSTSTKEKEAFSFQIRFIDMNSQIIERLNAIALATNYSLRCDPEFIHHSSLYPNLICGGYNISFF